MSENANETVFLTSEVEAKAGVVNCCDTAKWYGKDMTPEEKAELKKGQREWEMFPNGEQCVMDDPDEK